MTGRSGQQYSGTEGANRCQQCQPAGSKIPRFSAIRVSLHYLLHQAISPADLAANKWRRLVYENMEGVLIRGNNSWMSPLLPKINPNATCEALGSALEMASMERRHTDGVFRRQPHRARTARLPEIASRNLTRPVLTLNETQSLALLRQLNSSR